MSVDSVEKFGGERDFLKPVFSIQFSQMACRLSEVSERSGILIVRNERRRA